MFFARVPVLVEGLEDVSYITTELHLSGLWPEFRRLGCHLIPVNGKDKLIQPLAIAVEIAIPAFVMFDGDADTVRADHRVKHERDNRAIFSLLAAPAVAFPAQDIFATNHVVWNTNLTHAVRVDFGTSYDGLANAARANYAQEGGLEKNDLFIADWLDAGRRAGISSPKLVLVCQTILAYARSV